MMEPRVLFIQLVKNMKVKMNNTYNGSVNFQGCMLSCPIQGSQSTFQLTDEFGAGEPYAGLAFQVTDSEGFEYSGFLNSTGVGLVVNHFAGPLALKVAAD